MPSTVMQDYEVINTIGSGSYGICQKIRRKKDGKVLVWKELDYGQMTETEKSMLVSEVNLLRELKHKYIVRYYDRIIDRSTSKLYIIMEYCEGGDLATYISKMKKEGRNTDEAFVWRICEQIISALKECHTRTKNGKTVLHRDLKPANVFLDNDNNVKLGDFGLARVLNHDTSFAKTFVGTPYYMSPEQMNLMGYNEKSDVWSLGCLLYELCAFRPPFTASSQRELASKICVGHFLRLPIRYSSDLNELISHVLQVEEAKRPTIEQLATHPLVLKHGPTPTPHRSSTSTDGNAQVEALRRREARVVERETLSSEREKTLVEKERILEDKERRLRHREKELHEKEKGLLQRERELTDLMGRARRLSDRLSPRVASTENSPRVSLDSQDYEPGELLADSGIQSPRNPPSRRSESSRSRSDRGSNRVDRLGSAGSMENLLADFKERRTNKTLSKKISSASKILSPSSKSHSENTPHTPKTVSGSRYNRMPLETLSDNNRELVSEIGRRGSLSPRICSSNFTPQLILKDRVKKLFKKSPPEMFSRCVHNSVRLTPDQDA